MREEFVGSGERSLLSVLESRPVVPAVRNLGDELEFALSGGHAAVFVLGGDAFDLVERLRGAPGRPPVYVNVDLVSGVSSDVEGIRFLSRYVDGVISTHRRIIELAKQARLLTIQRLFAIDSGAVERGLKMIVRADPDFVEILPALAYPEIAEYYPEVCGIPVLAGGLVTEPGQVYSLLYAGASGVSTSESGLWGYEIGGRNGG
ncbi:MAG: glycerol-3-phosphate responsive antiterminator [Rubrobacter sp.]|nr:glycerol-3-phosphate responsive antiterminator [Rubrobacter sp.]